MSLLGWHVCKMWEPGGCLEQVFQPGCEATDFAGVLKSVASFNAG
jgi:hypothetical protein